MSAQPPRWARRPPSARLVSTSMKPTSSSPTKPASRVPASPTDRSSRSPSSGGRDGWGSSSTLASRMISTGPSWTNPLRSYSSRTCGHCAGHAVHAGGREGPVGVPVPSLPGPQLGQAGVHQGAGRLLRVGPVVGLRPEQQPVDLGGAAVGLADVVALAVAEQVGGGHHPAALGGHQGGPLGHPGVDDELPGVALQLAHDGVDRHRDAGHDGLDVGVDQGGELLAVGPAERAHLDLGHGEPPRRQRRWREGQEAATGAVRLRHYQAVPA